MCSIASTSPVTDLHFLSAALPETVKRGDPVPREGGDEQVREPEPVPAEVPVPVIAMVESEKLDLTPPSKVSITRRNQPGTDDHRPLSSAGEEFTECMDCFRQWTHLCTEDRQNSPDVEPWRPKPQGRLDRRGGGDGRQTERGAGGRSGVQGEPGAAAGRGGCQTDRGGGQAGRGGRRASGVGRGRGLNAGRDGDRQGGPGEPTVRRIPSTSAEEADTQSTT